MTSREQRRVWILTRVLKRELTMTEAADLVGLSDFRGHEVGQQLPVRVVREVRAGHLAVLHGPHVVARKRSVKIVADQPGQIQPDMGERVLAGLASLESRAFVPVDIIELGRAEVIWRAATGRFDERRPSIDGDARTTVLVDPKVSKRISGW